MENIIFKMKKILLSILFLLILSACNKHAQDQSAPDPCDKTGDILPINDEMKGFFFQPGSSWVYKNDSLNLYDSVVLYNTLSSCEEIPDYGPPHGSHTVKYFCLYYIEYPSSYKYFDVIEANVMYRNFFPLHYYSWEEWFLYAAGIPDSNYIDSLQVGSHTFYKCLKSNSQGALNPPNITAYSAKDIGIVKKIIRGNPNQEWDLVRWHIKK